MPTSPDHHPTPVRRRMLFTGRVQGVGFRYTTEHIAARHAVTGFVRNLDDGRVEAVVEGSRAEVDRFQHAVEEAMASNIRETTVVDGPAGGEFTRFSITF